MIAVKNEIKLRYMLRQYFEAVSFETNDTIRRKTDDHSVRCY